MLRRRPEMDGACTAAYTNNREEVQLFLLQGSNPYPSFGSSAVNITSGDYDYAYYGSLSSEETMILERAYLEIRGSMAWTTMDRYMNDRGPAWGSVMIELNHKGLINLANSFRDPRADMDIYEFEITLAGFQTARRLRDQRLQFRHVPSPVPQIKDVPMPVNIDEVAAPVNLPKKKTKVKKVFEETII